MVGGHVFGQRHLIVGLLPLIHIHAQRPATCNTSMNAQQQRPIVMNLLMLIIYHLMMNLHIHILMLGRQHNGGAIRRDPS